MKDRWGHEHDRRGVTPEERARRLAAQAHLEGFSAADLGSRMTDADWEGLYHRAGLVGFSTSVCGMAVDIVQAVEESGGVMKLR